jgi:hypothetical protein
MNTNEPVSLKWKVWLGFALIVYLLGNVDSYNLRPHISELQGSINSLEKKIALLEYKLEASSSANESNE